MVRRVALIGFLLITATGFAQDKLRSLPAEQLDLVSSVEEKPVVVFLHTDWCKFCKTMEQTTFQNERVIEVLNDEYYFVPFNAESKKELSFFSMTFSPETRGSSTVHALAKSLGTIDGRLTYPAIVILNKNGEIVFQRAGFMDAASLLGVLEGSLADLRAFSGKE